MFSPWIKKFLNNKKKKKYAFQKVEWHKEIYYWW